MHYLLLWAPRQAETSAAGPILPTTHRHMCQPRLTSCELERSCKHLRAATQLQARSAESMPCAMRAQESLQQAPLTAHCSCPGPTVCQSTIGTSKAHPEDERCLVCVVPCEVPANLPNARLELLFCTVEQ